MKKKLLTMLAIMVAIAFAAPSVFAAPPTTFTTPDKTACFYDTGPPVYYLSLVTKKNGNIAIPGSKVKSSLVSGLANLPSTGGLVLTGTAVAVKGKYTAPDGSKAKVKRNMALLAGGIGTNFRLISVTWGYDTFTGPILTMLIYNPATNLFVAHSLTQMKCRDMTKL